jgi:hypothetical protein
MRIQFKKRKQREFLQTILQNTGITSIRGLQQLGINTPYSTIKNYYTEKRTLPKQLFKDLCEIGNINKKTIEHKELPNNWGKTKGGKKSKRKK